MESSSTGPPLPNGESGDANDIIVKEDIAHEVVNNDEGKYFLGSTSTVA